MKQLAVRVGDLFCYDSFNYLQVGFSNYFRDELTGGLNGKERRSTYHTL